MGFIQSLDALRHRRRLVILGFAVSILVLAGLAHPQARRTYSGLLPYGWRSSTLHGAEESHVGAEARVGGFSRIIAGSDGFYVFENVYVRDRKLYLVQDPSPLAVALPELHKIITSTVHDAYDDSTIIERLLAATGDTFDPKSSQYDPEIAGHNAENDDYPPVPRMKVLSVDEAELIIPGFKDARLMDNPVEEMGKYAMPSKDWSEGRPQGLTYGHGQREEQGMVDAPVEVYQGMTFYLADDAAQIGWGALMHHYFHFVGEVLLGTYRAFITSVLNPIPPTSTAQGDWKDIPPPFEELGARVSSRSSKSKTYGLSPFPARIIIPWTTTWMNHDFNEVVVKKAFGGAEVLSRQRWGDINLDHHWRMFAKVAITDRNAAHNNYWSQTSKWNKMAMDVLHLPLPTSEPPQNFFAGPQQKLAEALRVSGYPDRRPGTEESFMHGKSLKRGEVRIIYVDRQGSDRKLDDDSEASLLQVLDELEQSDDINGSKVVVERVKFEKMDAQSQIKAAMRADIWLGIHGNGLTHLVWTLSGATVIELFPAHSFIRDYELLSYALQHNYYTVWNNRLLTEDQWGEERGGPEAVLLHDGTRIQVDRDFIRDLLTNVITKMS